jgi:hypothetical protein
LLTEVSEPAKQRARQEVLGIGHPKEGLDDGADRHGNLSVVRISGGYVSS